MAEQTAIRLLLFRLGNVTCGAGMESVREILPRMPAARIPGAPPAVLGLVNVRGSLVTVIDGCQALHDDGSSSTGGTVLLDVGEHVAGLAVDEVLDLVTVETETLTDREDLAGIDPRMVSAIGRHAGDLFVLLDLEALLAPLLPS